MLVLLMIQTDAVTQGIGTGKKFENLIKLDERKGKFLHVKDTWKAKELWSYYPIKQTEEVCVGSRKRVGRLSKNVEGF
jgi:hypothetical protein